MADSTMLTIVRHGRTALNAQGRLQGRIDVELDDVGRQQALLIAEAVGSVDRVIASPLLRARQTAEAFDRPVEIDERWIELDYGEFDGRAMAEIPAETWTRWRTDLDFRPPGGETLRELGARVREAADSLLDLSGAPHVVVATHVSPIKAALTWGVRGWRRSVVAGLCGSRLDLSLLDYQRPGFATVVQRDLSPALKTVWTEQASVARPFDADYHNDDDV